MIDLRWLIFASVLGFPVVSGVHGDETTAGLAERRESLEKRAEALEQEIESLKTSIARLEAHSGSAIATGTEEFLLQNASSFVIPEVNGAVPPEVRAVRVLVSRPEGADALKRLAGTSSAAGKLYVYCGLSIRAPRSAGALRDELGKTRKVIRFSANEGELVQRRTSTIIDLLDSETVVRIIPPIEFEGTPVDFSDLEAYQTRLRQETRRLYQHFYTLIHREGKTRDRAYASILTLGPLAPRETLFGVISLLRQDEFAVRDMGDTLLRELEPWGRPFMDELLERLIQLGHDELVLGGAEAVEVLCDGWGWQYANIDVFERVLKPGGLENTEMLLETVDAIRESAATTLMARQGALFVTDDALSTIFELDNGEGVRLARALVESEEGVERLQSLYARDDEDFHERFCGTLRSLGADGRTLLRQFGGKR